MKKILFWGFIVIGGLLLIDNPHVLEFIQKKPKEIWLWAQTSVQGVTDYKQERFLKKLSQERLTLTKRERRYVYNISKSSSDLLLFYNRYCTDKEAVHQVLDDPNLFAVCKASRQTLLPD